MIGDILGLVILAIVTGAVQGAENGQPLNYWGIAAILGKAVLFLFGALALGLVISPSLFQLASRLRGRGVLLVTALVFCFFLSWVASVVGLALIVGAYAAGLILENSHWKDFADRGERPLEELIRPLSAVLVPVFFVLMGMRVDLAAFRRTEVLELAGRPADVDRLRR